MFSLDHFLLSWVADVIMLGILGMALGAVSILGCGGSKKKKPVPKTVQPKLKSIKQPVKIKKSTMEKIPSEKPKSVKPPSIRVEPKSEGGKLDVTAQPTVMVDLKSTATGAGNTMIAKEQKSLVLGTEIPKVDGTTTVGMTKVTENLMTEAETKGVPSLRLMSERPPSYAAKEKSQRSKAAPAPPKKKAHPKDPNYDTFKLVPNIEDM